MTAIISDYTVGSDSQTIDFGTWSPGYKAIDILIMVKNNGLAADYELFINQDYRENYYYTQSTIGNDVNITGAETNDADIANISGSDSFCARFLMMTGPATCLWMGYVLQFETTANISILHKSVHYVGSNPSYITDIRLTCQRPSGFGAGSRILIRDQST